jgi:hypothetical protein
VGYRPGRPSVRLELVEEQVHAAVPAAASVSDARQTCIQGTVMRFAAANIGLAARDVRSHTTHTRCCNDWRSARSNPRLLLQW